MKKKLLSFIFTFAFILTAGFCLTACGGGKNPPAKTLTEITCSVNHENWDGDKFIYEYEEDIEISKDNFTVTAHYSDESSETVTDYTLDLSNIPSTTPVPANTNGYEITITYSTATPITYNVVVNTKSLDLTAPNFTNPVYNGNEIDITQVSEISNFITTNNLEVDDNSQSKTQTYAGNYVLTLKSTDSNVEGTFDINWEIEKATINLSDILQCEDLTQNTTDRNIYEITYDGNAHSFGLSSNEKVGIECTFSPDSDKKNVGYYTYNFTLNDTDNYKFGNEYNTINNDTRIELILKINQKNLNTLSLDSYNANNIQVVYKHKAFTVKDFEETYESLLALGDFSMVEGENIDNENASRGEVKGKFKIEGTGNYCGEIEVPFTILPVNFTYTAERVLAKTGKYVQNENDGSTHFIEGDYFYNGLAQEIAQVVYKFDGEWVGDYNEVVLTNDDYDISHSHNINASNDDGHASYTITGKGNYTGTTTGTFRIKRAIITNNLSWQEGSDSALTYNGEKQEYKKLKTDFENADKVNIVYKAYKVTENWEKGEEVEFINAGNYYYGAVATIKTDYAANYCFGDINQQTETTVTSITIDYFPIVTINKAKLKFETTDATEFVYNGNNQRPSEDTLTVKVDDSNTPSTFNGTSPLTKGTDYTIEYGAYEGVNTFVPKDTSINVGIYVIRATLSPSAATNYCFKDVNYDYFYDYGEIGYRISPFEIYYDNANINIKLPTINKTLWGDYSLSDDGEITCIGTEEYALSSNNLKIPVTFSIERFHNSNEGDGWYLISKLTDTTNFKANIRTSNNHYDNVVINDIKVAEENGLPYGEYDDSSKINYINNFFATFTVNGRPLISSTTTNIELKNLDELPLKTDTGRIVAGDRIVITFKENYTAKVEVTEISEKYYIEPNSSILTYDVGSTKNSQNKYICELRFNIIVSTTETEPKTVLTKQFILADNMLNNIFEVFETNTTEETPVKQDWLTGGEGYNISNVKDRCYIGIIESETGTYKDKTRILTVTCKDGYKIMFKKKDTDEFISGTNKLTTYTYSNLPSSTSFTGEYDFIIQVYRDGVDSPFLELNMYYAKR